jgi:hypothetical protein
MLIQWGGGYQETNGGFNAGTINGLGWSMAGSADSTDFEMAISLKATYASDGTPVFNRGTVAILLEGDDTSYTSVEYAPPEGGLVYTLASPPAPPLTNLTLVSLTGSSWRYNASGNDLGTNWLDPLYDDSGSAWNSGTGLFGFSPNTAAYPPINTSLATAPNTYYFRIHFPWTNDTANVAFVITNYLSDGALYYLNGTEFRRVRMPAGAISYSTSATATNSPEGGAEVFGLDASLLAFGDNILQVETHQAPASAADMVFGLSFLAAIQYPVWVVDPTLPADQLSVLAGQPVTFTSDVLGSGPMTLQWLFDDTNVIAGANGPSYTIPLVLTNHVGGYSLLASNSLASVTTRAALLTVSNIPAGIASAPTDQVVVEGRPVTFSVTASGTPVIAYQWFFGPNPIPGAVNPDYTIDNCALTNTGVYHVRVSNPAGSQDSGTANLAVLTDTLPPAITQISGSATTIGLTFSEPLDPVTASNSSKYSVSGGVNVTGAAFDPANPNQVTLNTGVGMSFGTVYTLSINGVVDLFGNALQTSAQFARSITIDGAFDDWTGIDPVYSSPAPSGNTGAADFKDIYVANDSNYYYFRVTLWGDIDPSAGQFPDYVNIFFDTDNDAATGYSFVGSELLIQSGFGYQEKDGSFNDNKPPSGLNWLCLPAAPGTNFEFQFSRAATFQDGSPIFTTNQINFMFQGQNSSWALVNQVPPSGVISYSNSAPVTVPGLPPGKLAISPVTGGKLAVIWEATSSLQARAPLIGGSWTNIPNATSPYVLPAVGAESYFRLAH